MTAQHHAPTDGASAPRDGARIPFREGPRCPTTPPFFRFDVYPAAALRVVSGANEGDGLGPVEDVVPGDTYRLARGAATRALALADGDTTDSGTIAEVADGSEIGEPGDAVAILACHTFMGGRGEVVEVLALDVSGAQARQSWLLPLADLAEGLDYDLVGSSVTDAPQRFADVASVSFLAGTQLTLADGRQMPVENLNVGDRVLTRDHGAQPIRWIGHQTRRATGAAAPITISAGTLNAARDLRLSPQHRLFIWQRRDALGTGRAEVMVKAERLVDGDRIRREEGGHVDSYQLVFDGHEIIYAEGIAVESLLVAGHARALLPEGLTLDPQTGPALDARRIEVDDVALDPAEALQRLSRASRGDD